MGRKSSRKQEGTKYPDKSADKQQYDSDTSHGCSPEILSALERWGKERHSKALAYFYFGYDLSDTQALIVRKIAWSEHKRIAISCMTRYGKTRSVAIAILLYILLNRDKKILLLAPTKNQTQILRNYVAEMITDSEISGLLTTHSASLESEVSKQRITFTNGCELLTLTAEGTGERLMGHGGDLIIMDESCLISHEVWRSKISRMLGDSPDSILVEIANPWHRDNHFFEHWNDPSFEKIHVDWKLALKEGRITQEYVDEQRLTLKDFPMEFEILYDSVFPEQSADGLISYRRIKEAINRGKVKGEVIISCDVADKGTDRTVIMTGRSDGTKYAVENIYSEAKSENTAVAGRLVNMQKETIAMTINVDAIGIGVGVISMLKQEINNRHCKITACHFGRSASNKAHYLNKKAEMYFRLKYLFEEGLISIPEHPQLIKELLAMRWERGSGGEKLKIIDPDKSPDFADALVYLIWKQGNDGYVMG